MPAQDGGASGGGGEGNSGAADDKIYEGNKHKKLLRLLTVFAYLSTVSGTAFMLSLYYLFLWTPKVQLGGKALVQDPPPPGTMALFFPEMAPQLAARMADEQKGPGAPAPGPPGRRGRAEKAEVSESQVPATPQLVLPSANAPVDAYGKRREARSTLMEMTTTQQMPTTSNQWGGGEGSRPLAREGPQAPPRSPHSTPPPLLSPTHRTKNKGGGGEAAPWHSTPHPHPAEVVVHA